MKRLLKRAAALALAGTLLLGSTPVYALAQESPALSEAGSSSAQIGRVSGTWTLDLWHYSGGYWKVGNKGSEKITISDKQIQSLDQYLQASQQAVFTVSLPKEAAALVKSGQRGRDWEVEFADYRGRDCSALFAESKPKSVSLKSGDQIEFTATPIFHFNSENLTLKRFVPGMSAAVPLVDRKYGCNIYSVFGNGRSAVQGDGYFNEDDLSDTGRNAIHPSMITGKSGALEAGHSITLGTDVVDSAGYSIGSGTFAAAGACGLHFEFPVSLVFTDLRVPDPPDPGIDPGQPEGPAIPEPGGQDPQDPGEGPSGPGNPADPAAPADQSRISALEAVLDLPKTSYAGHEVPIKDLSLYEIGGKTVNAARAAELGLGKGSFSVTPKGSASVSKAGKTGATAVFSKPGTYQVELTAEAANGLKDKDSGSIKILQTPTILEDIGGVQKENRKQKLLVTVAQDPKNPVNELTILLKDKASGENIVVKKNFSGREAAPKNSAHIKYRSLFDTGSDACFLCCELDFLTKWHETRTLSYEIRVKDGKGGSDAAFGEFEVAPDRPPQAVIRLEDVYYRNEGSGKASITADCASITDGDALQRTWQFRPEGGSWQSPANLKDLSFGSRKSVRFDKAGVGAFSVKLTVKDLWTEETLEEYITAADYLSSTAEASSRVDNVAPRVSLDVLRTERAEIFVLTETDKLRRELLAAAPGIKAALLAEGIAAEVLADFRQAKAGEKTGEMRELTTGGSGGKDLRSSDLQLYADYFDGMWKGGNLIFDGRFSYLLLPTVQTYSPDPRYSVHTYPFRLSARDGEGRTVWTTSVTRSILDSASYLRNASWGLDADGTYLYLMDGGKTALFDAVTGAYVTTLSCRLGSYNLVTAEHIYAFREDGIWRLPRSGGSLTRVYEAEIFCPAFYGGGVNFLAKLDLGKGLGLYRCAFEPVGEKVKCTLLEGSLEGYARGAECLAIDAAGASFVRSGSTLYAFDRSGVLLRRVEAGSGLDGVTCGFPVWSGDGQVRYFGMTGTSLTPKLREVHCRVYGIYTEEAFHDSRGSAEDYPNFGEPVIYAAQDEKGAIGVYLGGEYVYATGVRYLDPIAFSFRSEFRNPFGFPMEEGYQSIRFIGATANLNAVSDVKQIVRVAESREAEEARLKARNLSYDANYSYYSRLGAAQSAGSAAEAITAAVKAMKEEGEMAAVFAAEGSLTRSISLAPDTTYYYEYETTAEKDIFSVEAKTMRPYGMGAPEGGFAVETTHDENFDDASVDPFFTLDLSAVKAGRYRIGHLQTGDDDSQAVQAGTSHPVRFTVPAGYQAVLSADYAFDCASEAPGAKQLFLTRTGGSPVLLDLPSAGLTRSAGTFLHSSLLTAGSYTLGCSVKDQTGRKGRESSFWIDNLRVHLVKEGPAGSPGMEVLETASSAAGSGAVRRIKGSFTTPKQILHFGPYDAQKVTGLSNAYARLREESSGSSRTLTLSLTVPKGQQALLAKISGTGKGSSYGNSSGRVRYYGVNWTMDGVLAGIHALPEDRSLALYALTPDPLFTFRRLTGSHELKASLNTSYGAEASLTGLQMYVTAPGASVPSALQEGRFFEESGRLHAEDLIFSGSGRIRLAAGEGDAVRNLRIYTASGSAEEISLACGFKTEAELAGWNGGGALARVMPLKSEKEEPARVYAKGEAIQYQVFYGDYENDPSKKQHWVYSHEPLSDGKHPQAGKDLGAPIPKFWVDGKYTLTHWQEDSTGVTIYDKPSNRVSVTFYIQGGQANDAPWVKSISTNPGTVKEGDSYTVKTTVDDKDKEPLTVTVEVYRDSGSAPIGKKTVKDLTPNASGVYPEVVLSGLPKAVPGTYDVVVTVKDAAGGDVENLRFKVKQERSLRGSVTHTAAWEANRLAWNEAKRGTDAVRAANVFWPGETLVLNAPCAGEPRSVEAVLLEFPQYAARLSRGAADAEGKAVFSGQLWHSSMLQTIGTARPVPATVRFTARYEDGEILTWDVAILFDQSKGSYYQLHRNY